LRHDVRDAFRRGEAALDDGLVHGRFPDWHATRVFLAVPAGVDLAHVLNDDRPGRYDLQFAASLTAHDMHRAVAFRANLLIERQIVLNDFNRQVFGQTVIGQALTLAEFACDFNQLRLGHVVVRRGLGFVEQVQLVVFALLARSPELPMLRQPELLLVELHEGLQLGDAAFQFGDFRVNFHTKIIPPKHRKVKCIKQFLDR